MDSAIFKRHGEGFETSPAPNRNGSYEDHVMADKALPSPEVLRQLLRYEPDTGKLFWRERTPDLFPGVRRSPEHSCAIWNSLYAGREAFTNKARNGYLIGLVFRKSHLAHRVAWAIATGAWPPADIDHINRVRDDNRLCNIRPVSRSQNSTNRRSRAGKPDSLVGVFPGKAGRFRALICAGKKSRHLGTFDTPEEARTAYLRAQADYIATTQDALAGELNPT